MSDIVRIMGIALLVLYPGLLSAAEKAERMQLHLEEGSRFGVNLVVETRCLTELVADRQRFEFRRGTTVEFLCRVMEKRPDGDMHIEFTYRRIKDYHGHPLNDLYDSAEPNPRRAKIAPTYREQALPALIGRSFVARVAPDGVVREIEGLEDLSRSLHDALAFRRPYEMKDSFRKEMEDLYEQDFQKFFGDYWPLAEARMKETIQQLFLVWPQAAIGTGVSWHTRDTLPALALRRANFWTVRSKLADTMVVELASDVHTDASLCDPNIPAVDPWEMSESDFLKEVCRWCRRKVNPVPIYVGERKGAFNVDLKSGLVRDATWTEELSGIVPTRRADKGETERIAHPSKRTQSVSIQITPQGNNGTSKASESHP